jgi:SAM-dependent methyltransferase
MGDAVSPAQAWAEALGAWAIPPDLLASAPEPPWAPAEEVYRRRADEALRRDVDPRDRSRAAALGALEQGAADGSVLDVGAGAGAAGLALAPPATALTAVDRNPRLLASFEQAVASANARGVRILGRALEGRWPDVAGGVAAHDVVVSHHVLYDVPDIAPFLVALTQHARRLVVVEITARHPLAWTNPLWEHVHGVVRPERPTAEDAIGVLSWLGLEPRVERWSRSRERRTLAESAARARRNLCLPADRGPEIEQTILRLSAAGALPGGPLDPARQVVTISWPGTARD